MNRLVKEKEDIRRSYEKMNSDLDKACSKIDELERQLSDHDQMIQFEKGCYEEALLVKDREVVKLKNSEDHLTKN